MNVPKLRFKEFDGEWTNVSLDSIVERVVRKNKQLESKLPLTISADIGLVDQITYFNKNVAGKDLSGYYLLKKGEFAYNKSYSNGYPWGAIKQLENYNQGLLSTLYICFKAMNINEVFLKHYFETNHWHKEVSMIAAEGARNHGLLNIPVNEFFKIKLNIPEEWEQRKIGNLFEKIDKKIQLQQQKIDLLQEQKKGYMQKVFKQKINFGSDDIWQTKKVSEVATLLNGRAYKKEELLAEGKYRVLRVGNFFTNDSWYYSNLELENDKYANKGDLLYAWSASFGPQIWDDEKIIYHYHIWKVVPNEKMIERDFLYHWFDFDKERILSQKNGTTMVHITKGGLEKTDIQLPSLEQQQRISNFFNKLDERINLNKVYLKALQKQKQGFMQQMFI